MLLFINCVVILFLLASSATAQFDPESAHVLLYFPQLADGGSPASQWQTILTFLNLHLSAPAAVTVYFYSDDGQALPLDFGSGPASATRMRQTKMRFPGRQDALTYKSCRSVSLRSNPLPAASYIAIRSTDVAETRGRSRVAGNQGAALATGVLAP